MRAFLSTLLITLLGCANAYEPSAPRVASTQQAVLVFVDGGMRVKGSNLLAHFGAVIAGCPSGGYVAGAPGDDSVWISPLSTRVHPSRAVLVALDPFPVACLGSNDTLKALAGGPSSAWAMFADGGASEIYGTRVDAFDTSAGYLALGITQPGLIKVFPNHQTNSALTTATFASSPATTGVGNSISWSTRGDLLIGNASARSAGVYYTDSSADGGRLLASAFPLINPQGSALGTGYGRVVLVGDVLPDGGEEYIVSSPGTGRVYVFSGQAMVMELNGGTSFGAALALEPMSLGGVHALWVGEPESDLVHRYVLDQGTTFAAPPEGLNTSFGAAIAVDQRGVVAIGAPRYGDSLLLEGGAVFEATFDAGSRNGQPGTCTAGASCALPGCTTGTCFAGVFCQQTRAPGSDCANGQRCEAAQNMCIDLPDASVDAGTPDAGTPDAGTPDAGTPDAGTLDAGTPDAGGLDADAGELDGGVQIFQTRGCTSSGGLPLLLLLAFGFRSARARRGPLAETKLGEPLTPTLIAP